MKREVKMVRECAGTRRLFRDGSVRVNLLVSRETYHALDALARRNGWSLSQEARMALARHLAHAGKGAGADGAR